MNAVIIDDKELIEMIGEIEDIRTRDIPYVLATTLNNLAFDAKEEAEKSLKEDLNIHKKALTRAFRVHKATKRNLEAELYVAQDKWQYRVLQHHFHGGDRIHKGLEKYLRYKGYMGKDEILTPSPGTSLKRSVYKRITEQVKTGRRTTSKSGRVSKEKYFVISSSANSHLSAGVYARMSSVPYPISILRIASKPNYSKRFDLEEIVVDVYSKRANKHLGDAIDRTLTLNAKRGWK